MQIDVLDKGFVRLVDSMGNDQRIVDSARISTNSTQITNEDRNEKLIDYLLKHSHTSPFESVVFQFHIKAPIFILRQWMRHRMSSFNEISGRYSVLNTEFYVPKDERIKAKGTVNKQGSEGTVEQVDKDGWLQSLNENFLRDEDLYEFANTSNISNELARIHLPLATYSEMYWKIDLHNLFHFLKLRCDSHAQEEIREYGFAIAKIVKEIVPFAYKAFVNNKLQLTSFSIEELKEIKQSVFNQNIKNTISNVLSLYNRFENI